MTSSLLPTPCASNDICNAVVPEDVATACFVPHISANLDSNSAVRGPWANIPDESTSSTACFSSSPMYGFERLIMLILLLVPRLQDHQNLDFVDYISFTKQAHPTITRSDRTLNCEDVSCLMWGFTIELRDIPNRAIITSKNHPLSANLF